MKNYPVRFLLEERKWGLEVRYPFLMVHGPGFSHGQNFSGMSVPRGKGRGEGASVLSQGGREFTLPRQRNVVLPFPLSTTVLDQNKATETMAGCLICVPEFDSLTNVIHLVPCSIGPAGTGFCHLIQFPQSPSTRPHTAGFPSF